MYILLKFLDENFRTKFIVISKQHYLGYKQKIKKNSTKFSLRIPVFENLGAKEQRKEKKSTTSRVKNIDMVNESFIMKTSDF